jgi:hypothetical protein
MEEKKFDKEVREKTSISVRPSVRRMWEDYSIKTRLSYSEIIEKAVVDLVSRDSGKTAGLSDESELSSLISDLLGPEDAARLTELLRNGGPTMKEGLAHSLRSALSFYKAIHVTRGKVDR